MRRLRAFARLDRADRRLLVQALGAVAGVRLALLLLPFGRVHATVQSWAVADRSLTSTTPGAIAWAVGRTASAVPGANCLVQAFATSILLARHGRVGTVRIGARRTARVLEAHAWVECEGSVVVGDRDDLATFRVMTPGPDGLR
jgi:hypothetical protein